MTNQFEKYFVGEKKLLTNSILCRTMRGLKTTAENYPPIFAVVMRRPGATRLLECHAFACKTEDDAVAAAATLYRALLADLDANRRRPRHANGVGCVSLASIASSDRKLPSLSSRLGIRANISQAESVKPTASHPVRPPRTKKTTSVSSSVTEDESSKPSELQKAPRRKKKNSDVKAEDILEARGRRRETPKEKMIPMMVQNFNSIQKNFDSRGNLSEKEEWQNSKNKIFGGKSDSMVSEKIEIDNFNKSSSKIYDIGANGLYETVSNRYEMCPVSGKAGKNENLRKQTPDKESENVKDKMYEKTRDSYELIPSKDVSKSQEAYSSNKSLKSNALIHERIEKPTCKSEENSLYERANKRGSRERLYEDHFKDVDKIYSLAQEDIQRTGKLERGKIRSSQEDIFFARSRKSDFYQSSQENFDDSVSVERRRSRDHEKCTSGKRVSRVVTMDKPLKKQSSDSTSNLDLSECNQPRIRKRSRAGSEPPVSRSEDGTKNLQEGKLKRSQSDIDVDRGDLMTRVELPRRGSFLNPGSARRPNSIKGGTPLGFTELFDEFRNQEGLTSVDDILAAIIG